MLSSLLSAIEPVNPLTFIPDFDPLIDKLKRKFGAVRPPREKGSAILVPGQKKPKSLAASRSQTHSAREDTATSSWAERLREPLNWQELVKQAADKYVESVRSLAVGNGQDRDGPAPIPMEPFLELAGSSLIAALTKRIRGAEEGDESGQETSEDSSGASPMAIDEQGGGGEDEKPQKKKKKRNRKGRVGH